MKDAATVGAWLGGLLSIGVAVGRGVRWYVERRDRLRAEEVRRQLLQRKDAEIAAWHAHADLYDELQHILNETDACRVLLLKTSNGGGIPGPGASVAVSIESEVCANLIPSMADWQARRMDLDYSHLIRQIIEKRRVMIDAADLNPESMLAEAYRALGVTHSWIFKVAIAEGAFFFLSINFTKGQPSGVDAKSLEMVRGSIERIRSHLGHAYKVFPWGRGPINADPVAD